MDAGVKALQNTCIDERRALIRFFIVYLRSRHAAKGFNNRLRSKAPLISVMGHGKGRLADLYAGIGTVFTELSILSEFKISPPVRRN